MGDRSSARPLSSQSFAIQFTLSRIDHDKLRYLQDLMSHEFPSGDIAGVFVRALDIAIAHLEKRKFAATERPRAGRRSSNARSRHIPAPVRRAVWARDGGQCTFVSDTGRRCEARKLLEFDHIEEFAREGEATVSGIRLRCRLCRHRHNRHYAASGFMPRWCGVRRLGQREARVPGDERGIIGSVV
jgi:hypothetical protein